MKHKAAVCVSVMLLATALPAWAAWDLIGQLKVSPDHVTTLDLGGFSGPIEQIRLDPIGGADCASVRVRYANGEVQQVFAGRLFDGQDQTISFPNSSRLVEGASLSCRGDGEYGARIAIAADIARPTFARPETYSMKAPVALRPLVAPATQNLSSWPAGNLELVASRDFGALNHRSLMFAHPTAPPAHAIALQPVGADARCLAVRAVFNDGSTRLSVPNGGADMSQGRIYRAYIGPDHGALTGLNLTCEAANSDHVTINIYALG